MIKIGFWRSSKNEASELPWPTDHYDPHWEEEERLVVAAYLDNGRVEENYKGWSDCRVCGCMNGSADLTDDKYLWPQGLGHYVREHNIRPPQEFIDHALKNASSLQPSSTASSAEERAKRLARLEAVAREIRDEGRVEMVTVSAEEATSIPDLEPSFDGAGGILTAQQIVERRNRIQAANKIAKLDQKLRGVVPEWDRLTFEQKADKIRDLTLRRRRRY